MDFKFFLFFLVLVVVVAGLQGRLAGHQVEGRHSRPWVDRQPGLVEWVCDKLDGCLAGVQLGVGDRVLAGQLGHVGEGEPDWYAGALAGREGGQEEQ